MCQVEEEQKNGPVLFQVAGFAAPGGVVSFQTHLPWLLQNFSQLSVSFQLFAVTECFRSLFSSAANYLKKVHSGTWTITIFFNAQCNSSRLLSQTGRLFCLPFFQIILEKPAMRLVFNVTSSSDPRLKAKISVFNCVFNKKRFENILNYSECSSVPWYHQDPELKIYGNI